MTGAQSRKIHTEPELAGALAEQAHKLGIPLFMKEDLVPIIGDENCLLYTSQQAHIETNTFKKHLE